MSITIAPWNAAKNSMRIWSRSSSTWSSCRMKSEPRILIIDDDEQLCRLLHRVIARMGLTADSEATLTRGLERNRSREYAVVLLDVHLPDGNGLEIIPQLREVSFPPEIIIRVLQEKRFRPLGRKQEVRSDFRLICATNRNLNELVESGGFRQDLSFRTGSLSI
ncbi:MAG: sigma-54-dependent Fis family transcriptional regulator [Desulfohalobiaceae bacterium]|nr:sigma-54-dependent Fis family transcriptional regulator [Desulfohalobiaceae bacterium]